MADPDTFALGLRLERLKATRVHRRIRAEDMVNRYRKNLAEKVMELDNRDIWDLMDNRPSQIDEFGTENIGMEYFGMELQGGCNHGLP